MFLDNIAPDGGALILYKSNVLGIEGCAFNGKCLLCRVFSISSISTFLSLIVMTTRQHSRELWRSTVSQFWQQGSNLCLFFFKWILPSFVIKTNHDCNVLLANHRVMAL